MDVCHLFTDRGCFQVELNDQLVGGVIKVLCAEFRIMGPGGTGPCMDGETSHEVMSIGPADRLQHFVLFSIHQICNELERYYFKSVNEVCVCLHAGCLYLFMEMSRGLFHA